MDTLLYLVFGNKHEYQLELTYSVLSAAHFLRSEEVRIVLICDLSNQRPDLPVEHLIVSDKELPSWTFPYKYAAKAHALCLGMERYGGVVALIDTDTVFRRNPKELFSRVGPGRAVMHAQDSTLGDHAYWRGLLERLSGSVDGYDVSSRSRMMNSGVIGLHEADKAAIPAALRLMTALNSIDPVFNIEQLAITASLEQRGEVVACDDLVWHYWGQRRRFVHSQISALFPEFDADTFARYYMASLCAVGSHDNDWAQVALDVLGSMERLPSGVGKDFDRFRGKRLDSLPWLNNAVRERWRTFWCKLERASSLNQTATTQ